MKIITIFILVVSCLSLGVASVHSKASSEVVVVFKKEISIEAASAMMKSFGGEYHKGADSSLGKVVSYSTGPKFIIEVTKKKIPKFIESCNNHPEIYRCYKADWNKAKD